MSNNTLKLKITFLYQYFGTPNGSWSTRVYELTKRWVKEGHEVTVITAPYDKSDIKSNTFISFQEIEGIRLIVINSGDSNRFSTLKRVWRALVFSIVSTYYTLNLRSNIIIASSGPITIGIPGLIGKWLKNVPLVFEVRDLWPDGAIELGLIKGKFSIFISKWFEKLIYKNSALVVPCSIGMENCIKLKYPQAHCLIIPNASDIALFSNLNSSNEIQSDNFPVLDIPLFIYTGSLGFMDACIEIIEGCAIINKNYKYKVIFIGDGTEKSYLEKRVQVLNLTDKISFIGLISKHEVVEWYQKASASFVVFKNNSILSTSSPNKMFDSLASGVPIIQNTLGWINELVTITKCGINIEPANPQSMASAICYIIDNPIEKKEMGMNASNLAKNEFNRDILSQKYLSELLKVCKN